MKTIIFLTILAVSSFCNAQTATATANGVTATATSGSITTTTSVSVSVSIQNSDDSYSLSAKFDSYKRKKLEKLLLENLEKQYFAQNGNTAIWKKTNNGDVAFSVILSDKKLKINIDKDLVSEGTFEKFKALGEKISENLRSE